MLHKLLSFILVAMFLTNSLCWAQSTVTYTESQEIIANPERGLQKYSITNGNYNSTTEYSNINTATLTTWRTSDDKVTVIFRYFLLDAFLTSDISSTYLDNMQIDFDRIRNAGLKCIVRFSYSNAQHATEPQQADKAQIIQHLLQLAPVMEGNKDIILTHQAGLIGTWGEWYYTNSSEFGTDGSINAAQWQNRKDVVDAMLNATPDEIPIQVRYPMLKKEMYGNSTLNSATAYQQTPNARIGFFNDAFLNEWGDMGTYSVSSQDQNPIGTEDYNYLSNETQYTPMTGETNGLNPPRTGGENAVNELDLTNWTTLNRDYYTENFTNWINSGHYEEILRRLGYRYVLRNSNFTLNDHTLTLQIELENTGYARLFKARKAWLVLKHSGSGSLHSYLLDTDPRTWDGTVTLNETLDLSALPEGIYESYLSLPDNEATLASRSEYSIRMANEDIWDAETGYNNLSQPINKSVINTTRSSVHQHAVIVYPNPASSAVIVDTKTKTADLVSIINNTGQLLRTIKPESPATRIMLSDIPPGLYILQVLIENQYLHYNLSIE